MTAQLPIAALQMVSAADVAPNLEAAHRLIGEAAAGGARLVVLPEFFCLLGRRDTDKVDVREPAGDGPIQRFLAETAREFGVWLIGGTVPLASPEPRRIRNACLVHRPDGSLAARYGVPMGNGAEFFAYTDWAYRSEVNFFLYEATEFRGQSLLEGGLRLGFTWKDGDYEVAAFGRNITDEEVVVGGIDFNNLTGFINEPRTFGVSLKASF